ncbi:MAG TPA: S1 RNA-binding domain-containing protein, partial [Myxococcota bacterium]
NDRGPRRDGGRGDKPRGARDSRPQGPRSGPGDFRDMAPIVVETGDVGDFASMLAATGPIDRKDVRVGDKVRATCVHIGSETVFFELSQTQEAHAAAAEFLNEEDGTINIRVGDKIDAFVLGLGEGILLSTKIGKDQIDVGMLEQAKASQIPISGTVTGVNKGGIEVSLSGTARGFCPLGQIDAGFVDDPSTLIGKTLEFIVKEVKENGRNILLSRRALVEKQKKEQAKKTMATLNVGAMVKGVVTRLQPFGAFVDIGGVDGLIPLSELGWGHVKDPSEVLKVTDMVTVEVRRIEDDPKRPGQPRISLSLKAAQPDPFLAHLRDLDRGATLVGTIKKLETFGAFVELWPGVQGLVHISEIADHRIGHPKDVLNVDEQVQVRVLDVDEGARRIALSLREAPAVMDEAPSASREPRGGAGGGKRVARGTQVDAQVDRVEKFGIFVKIDGPPELLGQSAFLPASESGTPRGADLHKAFPVGTKMSLLIIDVDERGRLKVSKTAREQAEERALVDEYKNDKKGQSGLGTFGDLLKAKLR